VIGDYDFMFLYSFILSSSEAMTIIAVSVQRQIRRTYRGLEYSVFKALAVLGLKLSTALRFRGHRHRRSVLKTEAC
jgi:hypothetical protein